MTQERLHDLESEFDRYSWTISDREEMYEIEDEHIRWELVRPGTEQTIHLAFYVIADLGEETGDLRHISTCTLQNSTQVLYFTKRSSETWRKDVREFVRSAINAITGD